MKINLALNRVINLTHANFIGQVGVCAGLWEYRTDGPFVIRPAVVATPFGNCLVLVIPEREALAVGPFILDGSTDQVDFISPQEADYLASAAKKFHYADHALVTFYPKVGNGDPATKVIPITSFRNMVAHACFEREHQPDLKQLDAAVVVHNVFAKLTETPTPWSC